MTAPVAARTLLARAFGWGSAMALVRLACSFLSIKVTAVVLGPAGLVLVAQFSSLVILLQSMLGQGLVTGSVRQAAACGADVEARRRIHATALRMGAALAGVAALTLVAGAGPLAAWLLADRALAPLIALAALAVAAAMWTDVLHGALGVSKEVGLIARSTIAATLLGLALFASATHLWGLTGALAASVAVSLCAAAVATAMVHWRARGIALRDFIGPFDRAAFRQILGVYPMLIVHGAVTPLVLILVRDTLASSLGLEAAGFWQAAWRLSETYLALIVSSVTLFFMPSLGERSGQPQAQQRQILRTLVAATAAVASAAAAVYLLREDIVRVVFSGRFEPVAALMPVQLAGDVLKIAGWILSMALVATLRTRWFVAITLLGAACFVAGTRALVPQLGLQAAPWAYLATGALQTLLAVWALRDLLWLTPSGVVAPAALSTSAGPTLGAAAVSAEGPTVSPPSLPAAPGGVAR
jgi:PST family polysaccharide transporter